MFRVIESPRFHVPNRYGPVPTGLLARSATPFWVIIAPIRVDIRNSQSLLGLARVTCSWVGADRLRAADHAHRLGQRGRPLGLDAVDREDRRVGGERIAVAELRVVDEVERVGLAVVGDLPRLGQLGHELAGLVLSTRVS